MIRTYFVLVISLFFMACNTSNSQATNSTETPAKAVAERPVEPAVDYSKSETPNLQEAALVERLSDYEQAIFASGCFWCTEEVFQRVKGVKAVYSGYSNGEDRRPTYNRIGSGTTGYAESVIVFYNPDEVSYDLLLEFFFASHDPTTLNRQGPDVGTQYRSGVFYLNETQQEKAMAYKAKLTEEGKFNDPIVTEITAANNFYLAEEYHQDYYPNHPENPYIQRISKPKVEKFAKAYAAYLID
jgi:peptide-methionine (S)-S-oxide reductase